MNEPSFLGTSKTDEEILKYGDIDELRQLCEKLIDSKTEMIETSRRMITNIECDLNSCYDKLHQFCSDLDD